MNTAGIQETSEEIAEQTQPWKEKAQQWQQSAVDTARNASRATDDYVRQNVWSTIALAVMAGCALGFALGHSRP